jgi:D-alanine-D-alanine ligase-like ATP-grasp enzyme
MTPVDFARKLRRFVWRTRLQLAAARELDLTAIETGMVLHLYSSAARDLGLEAKVLGSVLWISGNGRKFRADGSSRTDFDSPVAGSLAENKVAVRALFEQSRLPVPEGRSFSIDEPARAIEFALALRRPCVVKPAFDTSGGLGVTINLTDRKRIRRAVEFASIYGRRILVEEMVPGDSYRFLVYKGRCLSVVRREAARIVGSGKESVRRLMERENEGRIQRNVWTPGDPTAMPIQVDKKNTARLREQGMDWDSVPAEGQPVNLAPLGNIRTGGTFLEVTGQANPEAVRAAETAAEVVGLTLAGVDIVADDIRSPRFYLLEINTTPYIPMHYFTRNPEQGRDPIGVCLADFFGLPTRNSAANGEP